MFPEHYDKKLHRPPQTKFLKFSKIAFRATILSGNCSDGRNVKSATQVGAGKTAFRKSISKSLLASSPNNFLKPKSVYGLMSRDMESIAYRGNVWNDFTHSITHTGKGCVSLHTNFLCVAEPVPKD